MTRRRIVLETILIVLAVVLFVANGLVYYERFDLTENRLHTVTEATREVLASAGNTITIRYFLSGRLSRRFPQPTEIVDLLDEFAAVSRGNVFVRVLDPADDDTARTAESLGVIPQQLDLTEGGERRTAIVYSGVVIEYLDRRETLPFVFGTATLEYDLTSSIRALLRGERRTVALLPADASRTIEGEYRLLANALARAYELRQLRPGEPIADDVDVALLLDARLLGSTEVAELASYLERGGALLVAYDSVSVSLADGLFPGVVGPDAIRALLAEYGISPGSELLLDGEHNEIPIEETTAEFRFQRLYPYPHWPTVLARYTSADHPVTARFAGLDLYWPTHVAVDPSHSEAAVIVASTPGAWLMSAPFELSPLAIDALERDADATRGQYGLVAVSRRPDRPGGVAVVADADFLRDTLIQATGSPQNVDFALTLTDWLSNDEALLAIRTRPVRSLALDAFEDPRVKATQEFYARAVNIVLVPGAVVVYGLFRHARRRRRSRATAGERVR